MPESMQGAKGAKAPGSESDACEGRHGRQARNDSVPGLVRVGQGSRKASPSMASDAGARARSSGRRRQDMTRLNDGLDGPYSWRLGVTRSKSPPRLWVRPDGGTDRESPPVDQRRIQGPPGTCDRPASAAKPGIIAHRSVAEWLKPTAIRTRPRPSNHKSTPGRSVAERLKPTAIRTRPRPSNHKSTPGRSVAERLNPAPIRTWLRWSDFGLASAVPAADRLGAGPASAVNLMPTLAAPSLTR
jgi:hypothetical protein